MEAPLFAYHQHDIQLSLHELLAQLRSDDPKEFHPEISFLFQDQELYTDSEKCYVMAVQILLLFQENIDRKDLICPQKVVQLNVSLREGRLPSRKRPAELVWVAQTGAAA